MHFKTLDDILGYLEMFQASDYDLTFKSEPEKSDPSSFFDYHVHKFWELKFHSPEGTFERKLLSVIPPGTIHCMTRREISVDITHHFINIAADGHDSVWKIYINEEDQYGSNLIPEILHTLSRYQDDVRFDQLHSHLVKAVLENLKLLIRLNMTDPGIYKRQYNIVQIASDYMENYYHKADLSITDIARFAGVTPQYLNSAFRKATGKTTRQNLIAIRLNHARELLQGSNYLVKDVASLTGWHSAFYFSNSYRHAFGETPKNSQSTPSSLEENS